MTVLVNSITNTNDQAQLVKFIITPYTRNAGIRTKNAPASMTQLMFG